MLLQSRPRIVVRRHELLCSQHHVHLLLRHGCQDEVVQPFPPNLRYIERSRAGFMHAMNVGIVCSHQQQIVMYGASV
jgi:hypothetical protein